MSIYDPNAGFTGTPDPARLAWGQAAIADARRAAGGASLDIFPEADFAFVDPLTGEPQLAEALEYIATVIRASKAWSMGWSGVNGEPGGALVEHASGKAAWSPYGLRVAPSAENLIANPRAEGSALPAVPTGWSLGAPGGTITPVGRGVVDGWPYLDVELNGTLTAPGWVIPALLLSPVIGDTYTFSVGFARISGTASAPPELGITKAASTFEGSAVGLPFIDSIHRRASVTRTMTAGADRAYPTLRWPSGTVFSNYRLRVFAPVQTKTDHLTSPVLPPVGTPGASVKAIEAASVATSLGWYRHDAGTLVVEYTRPLMSSTRGIVGLPDPANQFYGRSIRMTGGSNVRAEADQLTGPVISGETTPIGSGRHITAMRWAGTAHRAATDGVLGTGWTAPTIAEPSNLLLGAGGRGSGTAPSGTPIHRVRFFPRALSDAELEAITTPHWSA